MPSSVSQLQYSPTQMEQRTRAIVRLMHSNLTVTDKLDMLHELAAQWQMARRLRKQPTLSSRYMQMPELDGVPCASFSCLVHLLKTSTYVIQRGHAAAAKKGELSQQPSADMQLLPARPLATAAANLLAEEQSAGKEPAHISARHQQLLQAMLGQVDKQNMPCATAFLLSGHLIQVCTRPYCLVGHALCVSHAHPAASTEAAALRRCQSVMASPGTMAPICSPHTDAAAVCRSSGPWATGSLYCTCICRAWTSEPCPTNCLHGVCMRMSLSTYKRPSTALMLMAEACLSMSQ